MKLLLDEMFSPRLANELRHRGGDVVAVGERADLAGRPDGDILAAATAEGRALVTEDVADYARLARDLAARGLGHGGIVFTSSRRFSRAAAGSGSLAIALERLLSQRPAERRLEDQVIWLDAPPAGKAG
ncbi:MAG: DUF5615 family PIN-like protein [Thermoleophilaceae bacterium]|nr:DUF5615 family PIN-like protein [Thermoleophilaceae bacterium]